MGICDRYCKYFTAFVLWFLMASFYRIYDSVAALTIKKLISWIGLFSPYFSAYVPHKKKLLISRINGHNTSFLISLCKTQFIHRVNSSNLHFFLPGALCSDRKKMLRLLSALSIMKTWVVLSPLCLLQCHPCTVTVVLSDYSTFNSLCLVSSSTLVRT